MGPKINCAVFVLACICQVVNSAKILAVFSSLSYSDHLVFRGYLSLVTKKGHSIIVATPYPGHFTYPEVEKIVEIDIGEASAPFWDEYKKLITNTDDYLPRLKAINEFSVKLAIAQLKSKQMMALLINPNLHFDLVITEADVPLLYAIAEKYKALHISITTSNGKLHHHEAKGNPVHPVLYPDVNALSYDNMSFWDILVEFYRHILTKYDYYNNYLPLCELAAQKLLGLKRPLLEVEYDIDLLFIATNPALVGNRPTTPGFIFVDRMHIRPGQRLPQDLQSILDSATNGAVYFSMGAIQESEQLSTNILHTLSEAFRELPFTVLWKIGNTTTFIKPDNVIAQTWFPQQQVLAHRNVKAFITHGGPRSLEEAVYYGVPIVGFPNVKSRKVFIEQVTKYGAGEIVDPYKLDKENLKKTIAAVVNNNKYKTAMIKLKQKIFDSLISGPDDAIWWTEHLITHKTGGFFRSPTVGHSLFRYYFIDTMFYLLTGIFITLCLTYLFIRSIIRRLRRRFFTRRQVVPDAATKVKAS